MKDKLPRVAIEKHGSIWVDPDSQFICPECLNGTGGIENDCVEYRLDVKGMLEVDGFFHTQRADIYYCHCKHCGCKFKERRNVVQKVRWSNIIGLVVGITILAAVLVLAVFGAMAAQEAGSISI